MPRISSGNVEGEAQGAGHRVHPHHAEAEAERERDDRLERRAAAEGDEGSEGEEVDREVFRRPEAEREGGDGAREKGDDDDADERAEAGGDEGVGQRLARPALPRHRIAVEGCGDRGGLARDVEEDGGGGAAEQRAPVQAGQQDDGRDRVHREGERQQQRHAVRRAEPGQHADQDAEQHAGDHQQEVVDGQRDREAVHQRVEVGQHRRAPQPRPSMTSSGPFSSGTENHRSNTTKVTAVTPTATPSATAHRRRAGEADRAQEVECHGDVEAEPLRDEDHAQDGQAEAQHPRAARRAPPPRRARAPPARARR